MDQNENISLGILKQKDKNGNDSMNSNKEQPIKSDDENSEYSDIETARYFGNDSDISENIPHLNEEKLSVGQLEARVQILKKDIEMLEEQIEEEKLLFRDAVDAEIARRKQILQKSCRLPNSMSNSHIKIDPLNINTEELELKLKEYRNAIEESKSYSLGDGDLDLQKLRNNLITYKKVLNDTWKDKITKQKRKAAAKIFQKHLNEVDSKCLEQISKLEKIQKSFENKDVFACEDTEAINSVIENNIIC